MGEYQMEENQHRIIWKRYVEENALRNDGLNLLPEGEQAGTASQRHLAEDKVKLIWQEAVSWKTEIFLRGKVELFARGWVS